MPFPVRKHSLRGRAGTGAAQRSVVERMLGEAHHLYLEDSNPEAPNAAPRVLWPSCHAYRMAMYRAGGLLKGEAEPLLARIPNEDFALLASIELAAAWLGLPQHLGAHMGRASVSRQA